MKERDEWLKHTSDSSCQFADAQKDICAKILHKLKSHKSSWPFRFPVEPIAQGVPNYLEIIKEPMDLNTV